MKPFPEDPEFTPGEKGFDDTDENGRPYDLLGRKPVGQRLTELVDRVEQPLVIALDGVWGSGKSHFLKLWTGAHQKELNGKAKVIYFDAFEHDYLDDPLISLIGALLKQSEGMKEQDDEPFPKMALSKIKSTGMRLAKPGLRIGLALATAGASEMANAVWDEGLKAAEGVSANAIDEFWKKESGRSAAMQQFRDALTALTAPAKSGDAQRRIVFIIDELDRCRPDYSLTLLEIVKHFFAVPNVHFVLGANLDALEHSVRARYGAQIDATTYLQKFIHLKMQLPKFIEYYAKTPIALTYFENAFNYSGLEQRFLDDIREQTQWLMESREVSFRDFNRIIFECSLITPSLNMRGNYFSVLISLLLMRVLSPVTYRSFLRKKLTLIEVEAYLGEAQDGNAYIAQWILDFWRATFGVDKEGRGYREYLSDFGGNDRISYVHRFFTQILETFQPTR